MLGVHKRPLWKVILFWFCGVLFFLILYIFLLGLLALHRIHKYERSVEAKSTVIPMAKGEPE